MTPEDRARLANAYSAEPNDIHAVPLWLSVGIWLFGVIVGALAMALLAFVVLA